VTLALLATLAVHHQHLTLVDVLHVLLAHLAPLLLPHALPAPLDHIHLLVQLHAPRALQATLPRLKAKLSLRNAQCVLLAMEAHQFRILEIPPAAVQSAQLARIKLLLVIMSAHLVLLASTAMPLLDKQPSRQPALAHALATPTPPALPLVKHPFLLARFALLAITDPSQTMAQV